MDKSSVIQTITNLRRLLKFNQESYFDFGFSIPMTIDFICSHIEDDGILR